jgi:hypothetical protein
MQYNFSTYEINRQVGKIRCKEMEVICVWFSAYIVYNQLLCWPKGEDIGNVMDSSNLRRQTKGITQSIKQQGEISRFF